MLPRGANSYANSNANSLFAYSWLQELDKRLSDGVDTRTRDDARCCLLRLGALDDDKATRALQTS